MKATNWFCGLSLNAERNFMVRTGKLIILLSLFLFCASCKKEKMPSVDCSNPTNDIAAIKSIIVGKWSWAYEKYMDRASQSTILKTPQSEGVTRQYQFFKNNDVLISQSNSSNTTELYEVTTLDIVTGSDMDKERVILLFRNKTTGQRTAFAPVRICSDTLTLNYQAYLDTKGQEKWSKIR
jgi:hypothetical protein